MRKNRILSAARSIIRLLRRRDSGEHTNLLVGCVSNGDEVTVGVENL